MPDEDYDYIDGRPPWSVNDVPEPSLWTKVLTVILAIPLALDSYLTDRKRRS